MKRFLNLIFILFITSQTTFAQSLVWLPLYKTEKKEIGQHITLYSEFNLEFHYDKPSYITILSQRNKKALLCVPRSSTFEVFNRTVLVVSIKTPSKWSNGQPDFLKPRDTLYFIDLRKRKLRKNILWTNIEGKTLLSNSIELTSLNKGFNYDYALKEFSYSEKTLTLLTLDSLKSIKISLQKL